MNEYPNKMTSLPSPIPLGMAGVGLPPFWGGLGCGLSATVVGLSPRMTRIITKLVFVVICEISGKKRMKNTFSPFWVIDRYKWKA